MADFIIPANWKFDGSKDADTVRYLLPGHSVQTPHFAILDRKVPVAAGGVPQYRIRFFEGFVDADGVTISTRNTVELTCRWPQSAPAVNVIANIALMGVLCSNVDLQSDIVNEQLLPRA